ncbi:MAG TPA: metal-dependent hydrolase [Bacteroidota bacterium]|nr:metal-dependent hydrolase [Bacteroidota bacterium]
MDNITHSLTGALAAKIIETNGQRAEQEQKTHRTLFWLTVICANLPDIDALMNIFGDPFFIIKHHRGLTHSLLFAPVLAFLPAITAYLVTSVKNLKLLWMMALVGIYLHIFFDVITTFGTQLFAPLSAERYSLDWMFIIDPLFTLIVALLLFLGKRASAHQRGFALAGGIFVVSYLLVEMVSHQIAVQRMATVARQQGLAVEKVSALPQPLSIFRWMGLVQTNDAVYRAFFNVFGNPEPSELTKFPQASDPFVEQAMKTEEAAWFMKFARHPWIRSVEQGRHWVVEIHDMQFSFDPELASTVGDAIGIAEVDRRPPFVLRFTYTSEGTLQSVEFNR